MQFKAEISKEAKEGGGDRRYKFAKHNTSKLPYPIHSMALRGARGGMQITGWESPVPFFLVPFPFLFFF
jgi:hypothetical protein